MAIPILPVWASLTQTDYGSALFDILGIFCIYIWLDCSTNKWLALSGIFMGLAFGTKYLEASAAVVLFLLIGFLGWQKRHKFPFIELGIFSLSFALVALPWVAKNMVWFGDPLFPFLVGGERIDPERIKMFYTYAQTNGPVHNILDWLLLPFRLYLKPWEFEGIMPEFSSPSFLFPFIVFYPFVQRSKKMSLLLIIIVARYVVWAIGPCGVRYLLPVFGLMSIQAAYVIEGLIHRYRRKLPFHVGFYALMILLLLFTLSLQVSGIIKHEILYLWSLEERARISFLRRNLSSYSAISFADQTLKKGDLILPTGDGRTYYCNKVCADNDDQFLWHRLLASSPDVASFVSQVREQGYTHILLSKSDIDFFVKRDQDGEIGRSVSFLLTEVLPTCGNRIYADGQAELYEIICR